MYKYKYTKPSHYVVVVYQVTIVANGHVYSLCRKCLFQHYPIKTQKKAVFVFVVLLFFLSLTQFQVNLSPQRLFEDLIFFCFLYFFP